MNKIEVSENKLVKVEKWMSSDGSVFNTEEEAQVQETKFLKYMSLTRKPSSLENAIIQYYYPEEDALWIKVNSQDDVNSLKDFSIDLDNINDSILQLSFEYNEWFLYLVKCNDFSPKTTRIITAKEFENKISQFASLIKQSNNFKRQKYNNAVKFLKEKITLFSSNGLDVDIHLDGDEGVCTEFIFNNKNIDFFVTLTLWENESNNGILVKTSESYSDIIYETNEINENSLINGLLIVISVLQKLIREAF